jgi:hypothetical protein
MRYYLLRFRFLTVLLSLACSAQLLAGVSEQIVQDLKPLSGYVVGQEGQSYIIDLDAADGLSVGDVVTVVEPGAALTHPVSGESLGRLEKIKGALKVMQLRAGFSLARPVGAAGDIDRGDPIRRYQNVKAAFHDYTGDGEPLYLELRRALPTLQWQDYASATEPGAPTASAESGMTHLLFELRQEGLTVRDAESRLLKTYAWPETVIGEEQRAAPSPIAPIAVPAPAAPVPQATPPVPELPIQERFQPQFPGGERIARLPDKVKTADFIHSQGRMLVATTDGASIVVSEADERMRPVAAGRPTTPGQILSVHWWQPEQKEPPLLVANIWKEDRPEGAIFVLRGSQLVPIRESILSLLGTFDRDGDGQRELLLGQSFDPEPFFGARVRALDLRGSELRTRKLGFRLPRGFAVQGAAFADLTGDGRPELAFVHRNILYLHGPDGQLLYRSAPTMGGSLSSLTYEVDPELEFSPVNTVPFELTPVAADLNGDGVAELIVVAGERRTVSAPGADPGVKKSWLAVFEFRNGAFAMGKLGPELTVPVQGLGFDRSRLLLVTPESHSFSFFRESTAASHLLALSLW